MEGNRSGSEQAATVQSDAPDVSECVIPLGRFKKSIHVPGMIDADWQRAAGKGTHATLSRFDMHNTLIAAGPDFKRGRNERFTNVATWILCQQSCRFSESRCHIKWTAEFCPKPWPRPHRCCQRPNRKPNQSKLEKIFRSGTWRQTLQNLARRFDDLSRRRQRRLCCE